MNKRYPGHAKKLMNAIWGLGLLSLSRCIVVVDHDVDLDYHVRHLALPQPGGERELGMLVSRLHSQPLDLSRPVWECHLIEGLENHRFAIYFKAHHSAIDGMGAMKMTQSWLSEDPNDPNVSGPWVLASVLKVPVVLAFGVYEGGNRYRIVLERLADQVVLPRAGRRAAIAGYAEAYAARLEAQVRRAPHNWFNYYDFWTDEAAAR